MRLEIFNTQFEKNSDSITFKSFNYQSPKLFSQAKIKEKKSKNLYIKQKTYLGFMKKLNSHNNVIKKKLAPIIAMATRLRDIMVHSNGDFIFEY